MIDEPIEPGTPDLLEMRGFLADGHSPFEQCPFCTTRKATDMGHHVWKHHRDEIEELAQGDEVSQWLPLYALTAHAAGDFPLQSDRMAAEKFESPVVRTLHVAIYTATFVPVALAANWSWRQRGVFLAALATTHYTIDSKRWKEPREGFETRPIWFDQVLHLIALAACVEVTERV